MSKIIISFLILYLSSPRRPSQTWRRRGSNSERNSSFWIPAFAGMTTLFIILTALIFSPTIFAQEASVSASTNTQINQFNNTQSPQYANLVMVNILHSLSCIMSGNSPIGQQCVEYQVTKDIHGAVQSIPVLASTNTSGGALGVLGNLTETVLINPPVSSAQYLSTVWENFGFVKESHAQVGGLGQGVLNPVLELWRVSRNFSYVIMTIIFVVIGLMIMFRAKIDPQTVVSIQAALPGLVIGLIMITFSYFFASLLTDLAFVGSNIVGFFFASAFPGGASGNNFLAQIDAINIFNMYGRFIGASGPDVFGAGVEPIFEALPPDNWPGRIIRLALGAIAYQYGSQVGGPLGAIAGGGIGIASGLPTGGVGVLSTPVLATLGSIIGGITTGASATIMAISNPSGTLGMVIYVLMIAFLLYAMFRLLLKLVNNYLSIIFLTITAPFHFMAASLPGRQEIATAWVLNMLCNVLVFPAVLAVFYFVGALLGPDAANLPGIIRGQFNVTDGQALPLFANLDLNFIRLLIAYGALLAMPGIPDLVCDAIGRVGQAGQKLAGEISTAQSGGQQYLGQVSSTPGQIGGQIGQGFKPDEKGETPFGLFRENSGGTRWFSKL